MMAYCKFNGIGVVPWFPLHQGALARPLGSVDTARTNSSKGTPFAFNPSEADKEIIKRVEEVAKKRGVSMAKVALAWVAGKVSSPIVGISSVPRIDEAIEGSELELTDEEKKYLEEPYVPVPVRGHA